MISNEQIKQAIEDCNRAGFAIRMRDIAYVTMCKDFDDRSVIYKCLFGADKDYNPDYASTYDQTAGMEYLRNYVEMTFEDNTKKKKKKKVSSEEDISFEENKAEIIKLIAATKKARENGDIEAKDALKIEADLRVKLNDKFKVEDETKDQIVIVNAKYDAICPRCGTEVSRRPISKEEAMEMYGLVEKK